METQPSSWIDQQVQAILDELLPDGDDSPVFDERTAWTFLRYAYGQGYIEGLYERGAA